MLSKKEKNLLVDLKTYEEEYWKNNKLKIFLDNKDYQAPDGTFVHGLHKYPKFAEFYKAGNYYRQRSIVAANRVGKTLRALCEIILHCTQDYPDSWEGRKFDRPIKVFICGDRGDTVKRVFQPILLGTPGEQDGIIPKDRIVSTGPLAGVPGAIGEYKIKGKRGISTIQVLTYQAGREAYEGFKADIVYLDEECPRDILSECLLRTMTVKDSMIIATFTPDRGLSDTYIYFTDRENSSRVFNTTVTWDDVPHLTTEDKKEILASLTPQERECRSKGIPYLGKGKIYQFSEDSFVIEPLKELPRHWPRSYGMDVGYSHPTACVWSAWDRESDTVYIYSEYKQKEAPPSTHAGAILARGAWIPGVIDTTAGNKGSASQEDGTRLINLYEKFGLQLGFVRKGRGSVEEGILEVSDRLESGRLKVYNTCQQWINEYRLYRRDDNSKIVKKDDDLLDATRYNLISGLMVAKIEPYDDDGNASRAEQGRSKIGGY